MKVLYPILTMLIFLCNIPMAFSETQAQSYERQIKSTLLSMPTDDLVWIRAFNNTYSLSCKSHKTYNDFNRFSQIATKVIVDQMFDRTDWGVKMDFKYGFRKKQLQGLKKQLGTNGFCSCIHNHIMKGNSACLNP